MRSTSLSCAIGTLILFHSGAPAEAAERHAPAWREPSRTLVIAPSAPVGPRDPFELDASTRRVRPHPLPAPPVVGLVVDQAGTPLPNVRIVVAEANRSVMSGPDGTFTLRDLPPGAYHLDARLIGYAPAEVEIVVPPDGPEVRVTITMVYSPIAMEGLHVTAVPGTADPLRVTQSTSELSGAELSRKLGSSVAETLGDEPGISVRYSGPAATAPVIRGLSGDRVLVLENGQRTGDLSSTSPDHGVALDPLSANRIEVVRGPASLLYGNNALGGVVNVISDEIPSSVPAGLDGALAVQGETVSPGGAASLQLTLPVSASMAATVEASGRDVGDVRTGNAGRLGNTDFSNLQIGGGVGLVTERVTGGAAIGTYRFEYGLPAPPGAAEAGVRLKGERHDVKFRADVSLRMSVLPSLRVEGSAQWYGHDELEDTGEIGTHFTLRTQTARAVATTSFGSLRGAFGASGYFKQYEAVGEEALTPPANSASGGAFVYQEIPLRPDAPESGPTLQVGGRFDAYRIESREADEKFGAPRSRSFGNVSGSIGLSIPLGPGASIGLSAARAFRAPTVEELLSNGFHAAAGSFDVGDPDLAAEVNRGVEAVFRGRSDRVNAQFAAFYNRIDDYVFPDVVGDTTFVDEEEGAPVTVPLTRFAQAGARLVGAEGQIEAAVTRTLVVGALADVVRGEFDGGSPLPFMPAARLGASLRWDNGRFTLGGEVRHAFAQHRVPENELAVGAYTLVDLNLGLNLIRGGRVHSLTLRADNLLDVEYRDASSRIKEFAPNPGRNLAVVYRVLF